MAVGEVWAQSRGSSARPVDREPGDQPQERRRRVGLWGVIVAIVLVAGVALGWSGRELLLPPDPLPQGRDFSVVEADEGEVERSLNLNVSAQWSGGPEVINAADGVLTERAVEDGSTVGAGDVLYTTDLKPVIVAEGTVPAFRDLISGHEGADVQQLQALLVHAGVRDAEPTGTFDDATLAQLKKWQQQEGLPVTGTVPLGSMVFVPKLPRVVAWGETPPAPTDQFGGPSSGEGVSESSAAVGSRLAPGTVVARLLPKRPEFTMTIPATQLSMVERGTPVAIHAEDVTWRARLGRIGEPDQEGSAVAQVLPAKGKKSICGKQCHLVPINGGLLPTEVIAVPPTTGTVVPAAALVVTDDGSAAVVTEDGDQVEIQVKASAGGQAVVTGIDAGTRVRVPGQSDPAAVTP